jgi:hypothetical protein
VAESCATLPTKSGNPATNCALLDSAVSVMATWREPGGAGAAPLFPNPRGMNGQKARAPWVLV